MNQLVSEVSKRATTAAGCFVSHAAQRSLHQPVPAATKDAASSRRDVPCGDFRKPFTIIWCVVGSGNSYESAKKCAYQCSTTPNRASAFPFSPSFSSFVTFTKFTFPQPRSRPFRFTCPALAPFQLHPFVVSLSTARHKNRTDGSCSYQIYVVDWFPQSKLNNCM